MNRVNDQQIIGKNNLTAIKGHQSIAAKLDGLSKAAWTITHSFVFSGLNFSTSEKELAIALIRERLAAADRPCKGLSEYFQRTVIAVQSNVRGVVEQLLPSKWLAAEKASGYESTTSAWEEIVRIRQSVPAYQVTLKALAEAMIEMIEVPTRGTFCYWEDYFRTHGMNEALVLFSIACAQLHYNG